MRAVTCRRQPSIRGGCRRAAPPTTVLRMRRALLLVTTLTVLSACGGSERRSYPLEGQLIAVDRTNRTLTIAHDDIPGFMPGMTMAYQIERPDLLDAAVPGDLIDATLVVDGPQGSIVALTVTGRAPLPASAAAAPVYDLLDPGEPVPDVALLDQDGTARRFSEWRGQALAVTFIYTRCPLPDFCPAMDRRFAEVQRLVAATPALRDRVHLVSVTVDPAYDTPAVLAAHAATVGADPALWSFVTGEPEALDAFGRRFGVSVMRDDPASREVMHNLRTAVIDPEGRLVTIHGGSEWTAGDLVPELERAIAGR